jgi:histone H3/H4
MGKKNMKGKINKKHKNNNEKDSDESLGIANYKPLLYTKDDIEIDHRTDEMEGPTLLEKKRNYDIANYKYDALLYFKSKLAEKKLESEKKEREKRKLKLIKQRNKEDKYNSSQYIKIKKKGGGNTNEIYQGCQMSIAEKILRKPKSEQLKDCYYNNRNLDDKSKEKKSFYYRIKTGLGVLRDIKKYQDYDLLIRKLPFQRLVKKIVTEDLGKSDFRMQSNAIYTIQQFIENRMANKYEDTKLCANHAKRITIMEKDMNLANRIKE